MEGWIAIHTDQASYRIALLLMYMKRMEGWIAIHTYQASYRVALLLIYKKDGRTDGHTDGRTLVFIE